MPLNSTTTTATQWPRRSETSRTRGWLAVTSNFAPDGVMRPTSDRLFVDTNVLVYAHHAGADDRSDKARRLLEHLWQTSRGATSVQVLLEMHSISTRKARPPLTPAEAWVIVSPYAAWNPLPSTTQSLLAARVLQQAHRLSIWDAHVVATAHIGGLRWILSEDMGHEVTYGSVTVINPFRAARAQLTRLGLPTA